MCIVLYNVRMAFNPINRSPKHPFHFTPPRRHRNSVVACEFDLRNLITIAPVYEYSRILYNTFLLMSLDVRNGSVVATCPPLGINLFSKMYTHTQMKLLNKLSIVSRVQGSRLEVLYKYNIYICTLRFSVTQLLALNTCSIPHCTSVHTLNNIIIQ